VEHAEAFFGYLNRCQFLLQQGLPVSDVLYFYGENVPSFVRLKRDDPAGVLPGYDYDVINLEALVERTSVEDGRILLPDGVRYEALALPPANAYGLQALEQIAMLVDAGARVVGEKPARPIGLSSTPAEEKRFCELADRLWGSSAGGARGKIADVPVRDALETAGVSRDFQYEGAANDADVDYFHRHTSEGEVSACQSGRGRQVDASFRIAGRRRRFGIRQQRGGRRQPSSNRTADDRAARAAMGDSLFVLFRREFRRRRVQRDNRVHVTPLANVPRPWSVAFDPSGAGQPRPSSRNSTTG
jgi:hypothetical protein